VTVIFNRSVITYEAFKCSSNM